MCLAIDNKSSLLGPVDAMGTIDKVTQMISEILSSETRIFMGQISDGLLASVIYEILNRKSDLVSPVLLFFFLPLIGYLGWTEVDF